MPSEKSIDGMPKRPKAREWWLYITPQGQVAHIYQTESEPMEPLDEDELVLVREVERG